MRLFINFYFLLSLVIVISACFVVFLSNPVYCLLWLVLTFLFSASFLLILGCEFLALIFIVVYVGAIAVLFLFVIMLLDLKFKNFSDKKNNSFIIILFFGNIFLIFLLFLNFNYIKYDFIFLNYNFINKKFKIELKNLIFYFTFICDKISFNFINWKDFINSSNEIELYSFMLYDIFIIQFLLTGLILLAVLVGVVYLTNSYKSSDILDQSVFKQISISSNFFYK
jgi:NADH:ubiquinone oxidoreductase subunit 6 (subunit J)